MKKVFLNPLFLVALLPALVLFLLIHSYAVNVPVTDQYEFVPIFQRLDKGEVVFNDFWAQHNEHRVFFPTVILVALARMTHWNILAEIYTSFVIAIVGFFGIIALLKRHIKQKRLLYVTTLIVAFIFFSPAQWENWLWGWQLEWFLCVATLVWSINLLDRLSLSMGPKNLIAPVLLGFVATFSLGSGFLVWLAGAAIIFVKKLKRQMIGTWLASAVFSMCLYYFHYHRLESEHPITEFLQDLPNFIEYYLAYLGRPISDNPRIAVFAGVYILLLFLGLSAYAVYKRKLQLVSFIGLGCIGLIVGLLAGIARFQYGIAGAMSSRYTAFSLLVLLAIVVLAASLCIDNARLKKGSNIGILTLLLLVSPMIAYSWRNGIGGMKGQSQLHAYIYNCSRAPIPDDACLYEIYFPSTEVAKERLDYLKQKDYGGY